LPVDYLRIILREIPAPGQTKKERKAFKKSLKHKPWFIKSKIIRNRSESIMKKKLARVQPAYEKAYYQHFKKKNTRIIEAIKNRKIRRSYVKRNRHVARHARKIKRISNFDIYQNKKIVRKPNYMQRRLAWGGRAYVDQVKGVADIYLARARKRRSVLKKRRINAKQRN
jgi:hypothetical protein